ncbi:MAG: hypothetical protein AAF367_13690 [Pseudomonadota bacterium]
MRTSLHFAPVIIACLLLSGCATINWQEAGENWIQSICRDNRDPDCARSLSP